jgi:hypothetical protein
MVLERRCLLSTDRLEDGPHPLTHPHTQTHTIILIGTPSMNEISDCSESSEVGDVASFGYNQN